MRALVLILICFSFTETATAQLDKHTWFFGGGFTGSRAGIQFDFVTHQPTPYNEVRFPLELQENNIIVSDPLNGDVIFYSDGQQVIDGSHQPMPNGTDLSGSPSAMYGTAIVFDPSGCDRYLMFTVQSEEDAIPRKIFYSAVDLNRPGNGTTNNPRGDVDPSVKNIEFTPNGVDCAEGIFTIPKSGSSKDSWLFFSDRREATLYLYEITSSGVTYFNEYNLRDLFPSFLNGEIFSVKMDFQSQNDSEGILILGPGRNVNQATYPLGSITFNTQNGDLDPSTFRLIDAATYWTYGTTFSPDGSKLYISDYIGKTLKQYDFLSNTLATVGFSPHNGRSGGLQTGPDGKVYWSNSFVINGPSTPISRLSVVHQPNEPGADCELILNDFILGADINPRLLGALPSFGTFPTPPTIVQISAENCNLENGSGFVDPGQSQPPFQYEWDNGENTALATQLSSGAHTITFTDGSGCSKVLEVFIDQENEEIEPVITGNLVLCAQDNGSTVLTAEDGFSEYLWSTGESSQSIIVNEAGIYSITVSSTEDCFGEASVEVIEENLEVEILGDTLLCQGINTQILLAVGNEYEEFLWSNQQTTSSLLVDQPGLYSITVTDTNGCKATDEFEVIDGSYDIEILGDSILCDGLNDQVVLETGTNYNAYLWSNQQTSSSLTVNQPGNYSLTVTNDIGCQASDVFHVIDANYNVEILGDSIFCNGNFDPIHLEVEGSYNEYLWSNQQTTSSLSVDQSGIYSITVTDLQGCQASDIITVSEIYNDVKIQGDSILCEKSPDILILQTESEHPRYLWSTMQNEAQILVTQPGNYSVTVTDNFGCEASDSFRIVQIESPVILDLDPMIEIDFGESVSLNPTVDSDFPFEVLWTPPEYLSCTQCVSTIATPLNTQLYTLSVVNTYGCLATMNTEIHIRFNKNVYTPNVFSPNDDGINDFFTLYGSMEIRNVQRLQIFDRWGELIFDNHNFLPNNEQFGWNGEFNGKKLNPGVYVWLAHVAFFDDSVEVFSGSLTLIR